MVAMKQSGIVLIEVIVVVGTLVVLAAMGAAITPRVQEKARQAESMNNVRNLAILLAERSMRKGFPPFNGKNFVLSLAAYHVIDTRNHGNLEVFFSPGDMLYGLWRTNRARYAEVTVQALRAGEDFHELTSYAGRRNADRDYMITPDALQLDVPMICDDDDGALHHRDGLVVGYTSGAVRFVPWEQLGMSPQGDPNDPEPFLGDDAQVEALRALSSE
jgi:hypothetical protein